MGPIRRRYAMALAALLCLWMGSSPTEAASPGGVTPAVQSTPETPEESPAASNRPALPKARPMPIPGFDDDAAYVRSITERATDLAAQSETAEPASRRVDLLLAAANSILAFEVEPACTRRVLQLEADSDEIPDAAVVDALDRADTLLSRADAALQPLRSLEDVDRDWFDDSAYRVQSLGAFASGLRGFLVSGADEESGRMARRAASRLSPLLEDHRRGVSAAATFWQATLRNLESDPAPALSILEPALADPPAESLPHAFFSRVLRCRLVAKRGGHASAAALLMQIEERSADWFKDSTERAAAVRTAQLVRLQVLADWHERLDPTRMSDERRWCEEQIRRLSEEHFGDDRGSILRLSPAIPMLAQP